MKSFSRLLFYFFAVATVFVAACDDTEAPPPPEPPPQISVLYRFTQNPNPADTLTGLQDNDAFDVLEDSNGKTWVATQSGVSRYVGRNGDGVFNQTNVLPNPKCRVLMEHEGTLYIGTWGGGVGTYNMAGNTWSKLNADSGLVNNMVGDIAAVGQEIYFATNGGVSIYTDNRQLPMVQRWREYTRLLTPVVSAVVIAETSTRGREVWYAPRWEELIQSGDEGDYGITVAREGLSQPIYYTMLNSGLLEPNVNDIYFDPSTELFWVGFSTKGLASVDVDASTWTYYSTADGMPSNVVYSITKIGEVLWVGTQGGVARMKSDGTFQGYDRRGGVPGDRVRKVYSPDPTRLWVGLIDAGAALLDPNSAQ